MTPVRASTVIDPSHPSQWSQSDGASLSISSPNMLAIRSPTPVARNSHPHESDGVRSPVLLRTSPLHATTKRYPSSPITMSPATRVHNHHLTASRIHMIASARSMRYAGICISVSGKGNAESPLRTTGDMIPVKILTTPSIPRCIRERVIREYII